MEYEELRKRRGTFEITRELIEDAPDEIQKVMGQTVIVRAESLFYNNSIQYHGYSSLFREVAEGEETPRYIFEATKNEDGEINEIKAREISR
jgi:hypothetical protein